MSVSVCLSAYLAIKFSVNVACGRISGPDLQNILRFIIGLFSVYRKINL